MVLYVTAVPQLELVDMAEGLLVNIDVPDLARAVAFYTEAFGLTVTRRFGADGVELSGWPVRVYLLRKPAGTIGASTNPRRYDRHWTPVHLDVVGTTYQPHSPMPWRPARLPRHRSGLRTGAGSWSWAIRSVTGSVSSSSSAAVTTKSPSPATDQTAGRAYAGDIALARRVASSARARSRRSSNRATRERVFG